MYCHVSLWGDRTHNTVPDPLTLFLVVADVVHCNKKHVLFSYLRRLVPGEANHIRSQCNLWLHKCQLHTSMYILMPEKSFNKLFLLFLYTRIEWAYKSNFTQVVKKVPQLEGTDLRSLSLSPLWSEVAQMQANGCWNMCRCTVLTSGQSRTHKSSKSLHIHFDSYFSGLQQRQRVRRHSGSSAVHSEWFLEDDLGTKSKRHRHGNQLHRGRTGEFPWRLENFLLCKLTL